jgi:uncharacterized protein (UPF0254 family)
MKQTNIRSLGFSQLTVSVPDSYEEFDRLAKRAGAALDEAVKNVLYRSTLASFRDLFTEELQTIAGLERHSEVIMGKDGVTPKVDEDKNELSRYTETENDYFDRAVAHLMATKGLDRDSVIAELTTAAQAVLDKLPFDPSATERASAGPKKVAKTYIEVAEKLIAEGRAETVAAKLSELLGITVTADVQSLGRAIAEDQRRKRLAIKSEY